MKNVVALLVLLVSFTWLQAADETVRVVVLGDSITRGARSGVTMEQTFGALLKEGLAKQKIAAKVINQGIGGEQSNQAVARLDKIIALKPQIVTVMYGTNDCYIYPKTTESKVTPKQFRDNLAAIVDKLRKAGIQPVLMTEPCWGPTATKNPLGDSPNVGLEKYMQITREVAKETVTPLVDNYAYWTAKQKAGTDVGAWTTDQCHPNPRGHEEIANLMLPVILKLLDKK